MASNEAGAASFGEKSGVGLQNERWCTQRSSTFIGGTRVDKMWRACQGDRGDDRLQVGSGSGQSTTPEWAHSSVTACRQDEWRMQQRQRARPPRKREGVGTSRQGRWAGGEREVGIGRNAVHEAFWDCN